ncbi:MAG: insulinase family protein [Clostridia bacterium]|nr:insulinase family protein [Clostridia bacterium]
MKIYTKTYNNGLRLILEKNNKNVIASNILFKVGSQNESKTEEGYSHFIEHLVFKSSEKYTTEEIMDKFTMLGADFNAYTSKTVTRFIFKCLAENFEPCFEIYSDMLLHPKFLQEELDRERNVVIEEMKKYEDEPSEVMYQGTVENYFDGTTLAHDILGTEEIISNVTRAQLLEYKSRFYIPEKTIISVCGNIDFEKLDEIVTKYFISEYDYNAEPEKVDYTPLKINIKEKYKIIERDDNQANVCIHIKSVTYDSKLKYVANLYTSILGNSQNSRLYKKIREELGLVYSIYAYSEIKAGHGEMFIIFGTRPKNVQKAIFEIKKIIQELAENGATEVELERAKIWKKSCMEFSSETNSDIAEINGSLIHNDNKHTSLSTRKSKFEKVKLEDINKFAKRIANEKVFNIVAVGKDINIEDLKQF